MIENSPTNNYEGNGIIRENTFGIRSTTTDVPMCGGGCCGNPECEEILQKMQIISDRVIIPVLISVWIISSGIYYAFHRYKKHNKPIKKSLIGGTICTIIVLIAIIIYGIYLGKSIMIYK